MTFLEKKKKHKRQDVSPDSDLSDTSPKAQGTRTKGLGEHIQSERSCQPQNQVKRWGVGREGLGQEGAAGQTPGEWLTPETHKELKLLSKKKTNNAIKGAQAGTSFSPQKHGWLPDI